MTAENSGAVSKRGIFLVRVFSDYKLKLFRKKNLIADWLSVSVCLSVCECLCEERIYLSIWTVLYTRHAARLRVNFASIPICVFADEFYDKTGTLFHNLPLSSSLIFRIL